MSNPVDVSIDRWIERHRDNLIALAQELVRIPTENHPPGGDEAAGQRFVQEQLEALGAEVDCFTPDDVPAMQSHPAYFPTINGRQRDFTNRPDVVGRFRG